MDYATTDLVLAIVHHLLVFSLAGVLALMRPPMSGVATSLATGWLPLGGLRARSRIRGASEKISSATAQPSDGRSWCVTHRRSALCL